jgi:hypothetical protein
MLMLQVVGESSKEAYWINHLVQILLGPVWTKAASRPPLAYKCMEIDIKVVVA